MFQTREWVMFVAGCVFVLGAIMVTVWSEKGSVATVPTAMTFMAGTAYENQSATVVMADSVEPETAMASMREKIASYRGTNINKTDHFVVASATPVVASAATSSGLETTTKQTAQYCNPTAIAYNSPWPRDVLIEEREGVRVVYVATAGMATGTVRLPETLLLQLPAPGRPGIEQRCLPNEVVGVAQDGSLIRNDEVALYQIFSASTVVGYALDGFPIYGKNNQVQVDACGGAMGIDGYGYILQSDRESILQCFRNRPAQL